MEAFQTQCSLSLWGRSYLIVIYSCAVALLVQRMLVSANSSIAILLLVFISVLFVWEWRRNFCGVKSMPTGIKYYDKNWQLLVSQEWLTVRELQLVKRLPFLLVLSYVTFPAGKKVKWLVWRDTLDSYSWQRLIVCLSL